MPVDGIKVLFIDRSWDIPYNIHVCQKSTNVMCDIATFMPDVIVTSTYMPGSLKISGFEIRKRWIHIDPNSTNERVMNAVESCYYNNLWSMNPNASANKLITIFTGTYNTGDNLRDTYQSLREQTYTNWEWVVVDDFSVDGTWDRLLAIADEDYRVRPIRTRHIGKVGAVKDIASKLSRGEYLVELDHDDMLTDNAVHEIMKAFNSDESIGMVYTNCAAFFADGQPHSYSDPFWKDRYRETVYRGRTYLELRNPNIYDRFGPHHTQQFGWFLTVGPNHIRAYRASTLQELGGYNRELPVADDWDLYARFFLRSKCAHLDKMLYLYRFHDNYENTTFTHNKSIQDHLALGRRYYEREFIEFNNHRQSTNINSISFVVIDYNTPDLTKTCLQSIRKFHPDDEVILIQNGNEFDDQNASKTIKLEQNIGFGAACNLGALGSSGEYICFINSDAELESDSIRKIIHEMCEYDLDMAGPYSDHAKYPQGNYDVPPPDTKFTPMVSGFCMVVRRDKFDEAGGFDFKFCNFEDDDLCRRIGKCGIIGGTHVKHAEHASFDHNDANYDEILEKSRSLYDEKWPKVKVIAITFNEREALPGFIEQYRNIADEFAILDSGSTDGTTEWATEHGVEVYHRPFDRFDHQRNHAIDIAAGDSEWVIMHDPDERVDVHTLSYLRELITRGKHDIYLSPLQSKEYDGTFKDWVPKAFLFRNNSSIRWINAVHEKLIGSHHQAMISNSMITHVLELHDKARRSKMAGKYDILGGDAELLNEWPILNYDKTDDDRIEKIVLGPPVSVIIPTYDRPDLLLRATQSVQRQDYINTETIVVSDGQNIEVPTTCKLMCLDKNHGAGGAIPRNYGIMMSSSKYIAYLDDDNYYTPNHLSSMMNVMDDARYVLSSMMIRDKARYCDKPICGLVDTSCLLHEKSLVREYGFWRDRTEDGYQHDWRFVERWVNGGEKWAATMEPTLIYNVDTCGQKEYLLNTT